MISSDVHLLHAEVPGRRRLSRAAGDRRHRQTPEEEVHGGQEGLQETDGAESRASVGSKVHFVGVGAGQLEERLIQTSKPGGEETDKMFQIVPVTI